MTDAEIVAQLRSFHQLKGWPVLREAADKLEAMERVLLNISLMDCDVREGEEPIHELMMRQASQAVTFPVNLDSF